MKYTQDVVEIYEEVKNKILKNDKLVYNKDIIDGVKNEYKKEK